MVAQSRHDCRVTGNSVYCYYCRSWSVTSQTPEGAEAVADHHRETGMWPVPEPKEIL